MECREQRPQKKLCAITYIRHYLCRTDAHPDSPWPTMNGHPPRCAVESTFPRRQASLPGKARNRFFGVLMFVRAAALGRDLAVRIQIRKPFS